MNNGVNGTVGAGAVTPAATAMVVAQAQNLEPLPPTQNTTELEISREPGLVLAEAQKAAAALRDVISRKERPVRFNGEQYLEFEDWQTVGRFYGITAKVSNVRLVEFGDIRGFEATAEALHAQTGRVVSSATSMCLNEERNWSNKPLFQLMSMAETRACAKVLRNVLSWVVVLAGYRPTPAEEMHGVPGFQDGIDIGDNRPNSRAAQQYVAEKKIAEMTERAKPWKNFGQMKEKFAELRERVGETAYAAVMGDRKPERFNDPNEALSFYQRLLMAAREVQ